MSVPPEISNVTGSRILSRYEILEKLGQGGMGVVYKARDTRLDRFVALKFLPSHLESSPASRERLEREARAVSALSHPNIRLLYGIEEWSGQDVLILEYLPAGTLRSKLGEAKGEGRMLAVADCTRYVSQIAEGLCHAHNRGLVHRDVKAENILFNDEGTPKITDFGRSEAARNR